MSNKACAICLVMLLLAAGAVAVIYSRPVPAVVQTNLEKLPMVLSGYAATEDAFSDAVYQELNADKNLYRHYKSPKGDKVDLYIGYYGTAKGGRTGHNPNACLPGSGMAIVDNGLVHLKQAASGKIVPVKYVLARKDDANTVMLHWYQTAGKTVVSMGFKQNIERFKGRVWKNRNDGAFVRVSANCLDADLAKNKMMVERFAETVLNLLPDYWPEEQ